MKSLDELFQHAKTVAASSFNRRGHHLPTFLLDAPRGIVTIPAPWGDQQQKLAAVLAVRSIARSMQATRVVVVTEGWMVTRPPGTNTDGLIPSQQPDRVEVIWIVGQSAVPGEVERAGIYKIERSRGKAKVGEWTSADDGPTMSIFDGIVGGRVLQ